MYKRILVAVDGSATSRHAFDAALALAQTHGAELQPYYVVEDAAIYYTVPGYDPTVLRDQLLEQGKELAKEFSQRMQTTGVKGEVKLAEASSLTDVSTLTFWTSPKLIGVGLATFSCVPISTPEPKTNIRVNSVGG